MWFFSSSREVIYSLEKLFSSKEEILRKEIENIIRRKVFGFHISFYKLNIILYITNDLIKKSLIKY